MMLDSRVAEMLMACDSDAGFKSGRDVNGM